MEIRQAILKAADHIEANPGEFRFTSVQVPSRPGCGTPGCAIGWVAAFKGKTEHQLFYDGDGDGFDGVLEVDAMDFYSRMTELCRDWAAGATDCAVTLRRYADKYHPDQTEQYPEIMAELDRISERVAA